MARFRPDYDTGRRPGPVRRLAAARTDGVPPGAGDGPAGPRLARPARRAGRRPGHRHRRRQNRRQSAPSGGSYGDPVSALYEQHYAPLVRLAALLVQDTATAEVIVQDSFVAVAAAWRRRGAIDGALDPSASRCSTAPGRRCGTGSLRPGVPAGPPPLLAALGALPARQREVLVLRYYANLSEEQAADTIGISCAAVRRHATRANAALRTLLDAG